MPFITESITGLGIFFCVQGWPVPQHWCVDQVGVCLLELILVWESGSARVGERIKPCFTVNSCT